MCLHPKYEVPQRLGSVHEKLTWSFFPCQDWCTFLHHIMLLKKSQSGLEILKKLFLCSKYCILEMQSVFGAGNTFLRILKGKTWKKSKFMCVYNFAIQKIKIDFSQNRLRDPPLFMVCIGALGSVLQRWHSNCAYRNTLRKTMDFKHTLFWKFWFPNNSKIHTHTPSPGLL